MNETIVAVAYDCLTPVGADLASTWKSLVSNHSGVRFITRYDYSQTKLRGVSNVAYAGEIQETYAQMAGSPGKYDKSPEPASHTVKAVCKRLLVSIGFDISKHNAEKVAILGGTALTSQVSQDYVGRNPRPYVNFILNQCHNIPLSQVSQEFGIKGPSFAVGSACASSAHALAMAVLLLRTAVIDAALVVGFEFPLAPACVGGFEWLNATYKRDKPDDRAYDDPTKASRPFSGDRRGFVIAEGVGAVLLTRLTYAQQFQWPNKGKVLGFYLNSDGDHLTRANATSVTSCIRNALGDARISIDAVGCINAHATSTPTGDATELTALYNVFGQRLSNLPVVANKSQLGHSLGAAAILSFILSLESMDRGIILPTLNYDCDASLPSAMICDKAYAGACHTTLINSFGFGGTNTSLLVGRGSNN